MKSPRADKHGKCDRALELSEKGLMTAQIAERLGSNARSIAVMISVAKKKRETAASMRRGVGE